MYSFSDLGEPSSILPMSKAFMTFGFGRTIICALEGTEL